MVIVLFAFSRMALVSVLAGEVVDPVCGALPTGVHHANAQACGTVGNCRTAYVKRPRRLGLLETSCSQAPS